MKANYITPSPRAFEAGFYASTGISVVETAEKMGCSVANVKALRVRFVDCFYSPNMIAAVRKAAELGIFKSVTFCFLIATLPFQGSIPVQSDGDNGARVVRRARTRRDLDFFSDFLSLEVS